MVTASHNPICDNGMKIIDPDGGMLDTHWEDVRKQIFFFFFLCSHSSRGWQKYIFLSRVILN